MGMELTQDQLNEQQVQATQNSVQAPVQAANTASAPLGQPNQNVPAPQPQAQPSQADADLPPVGAAVAPAVATNVPKHRSVASQVLGAIADVLGGSTTRSYSVDPATGKTIVQDNKATRGQQFARIVGSALQGGSAGAQTKNFGQGMAAGAGKVMAHEEELDDKKREQANQEYRNMLAQAANARAQQQSIMFAKEHDQRMKESQYNLERLQTKDKQDIADRWNTVQQAGAKPMLDAAGNQLEFGTLDEAEKWASDPKNSSRIFDNFQARIDVNPKDGKFVVNQMPINKQWYEVEIAGKKQKMYGTPAEYINLVQAQTDARTSAANATTAEAKAKVAPEYAAAELEGKKLDNQKTKAEINRTNAEASKARMEMNALSGDNMSDDSLVNGMLAGQIDIDKVANMRNGRREILYKKAMAKDPSFNQSTYKVRLKAQEYMSPGGKGSEQVVALNTFAGHAGDANELIEGLRNSKSPLLNKPLNKVREALGNDKLAPYEAALAAAREEYLNFLKGGHAPTKEEIELGDRLLNKNMPPSVAQGVLRQMSKTVMIRARSLDSQYKQVMKRSYPNMFNGDSAKILETFGHGDMLKKFGIDGVSPDSAPNDFWGNLPKVQN